jgi:hypothetical protein
MSIGAEPISEDAIAAQPSSTSTGKGGGPPPKRTAVATSDTVPAPEPR